MKTMARIPVHGARMVLTGPQLIIITLYTLGVINFRQTFNRDKDEEKVFQFPILSMVIFNIKHYLPPTEKSRNENIKDLQIMTAIFLK